MTITAGVDPGKDGAVVFARGNLVLVSARTKDWTVKGRGATYRVHDIAQWLVELEMPPGVVAIERQTPRPRQGPGKAQIQGFGAGLWVGLFAALGWQVLQPLPRTWQKEVLRDLPAANNPKSRSILGAGILYPDFNLGTPPHDGLADAACLAYFARLRATIQ